MRYVVTINDSMVITEVADDGLPRYTPITPKTNPLFFNTKADAEAIIKAVGGGNLCIWLEEDYAMGEGVTRL